MKPSFRTRILLLNAWHNVKSVTFKWVVNRSLPAVSYLTSLDKYSIVCIFFICTLCVWHSIVASFWPKDSACPYLDKYLLIAFGLIFVLIHVGLLIWFVLAHNEVRKVKKQEKLFLDRVYKKTSIDEANNHTDTDTNDSNRKNFRPIKYILKV